MTDGERNYGADLARIVGMILVILIHIHMPAGLFSEFTNDIAQCCINVFAIVSGFVGLTAKYRYGRIVKLWIQVFITGVLVGLLTSFAIGYDLTKTDVLKMVLPVSMREYWYFTDYFLLFFFMPMLNAAVRVHTRQILICLGVCTVLFTWSRMFLNVDALQVHNGFSFTWLAFLYLIGAELRIHEDRLPKARYWAALFLITAGGLSLMNLIPIHQLHILSSLLSCLYTGFGTLILSVAIVGYCVKTSIKHKGAVIAFWSSATFGVYLLHVQPIFFTRVWPRLFSVVDGFEGWRAGVMAWLCAVVAFVILALVEKLRQWLFRILGIDRKILMWVD